MSIEKQAEIHSYCVAQDDDSTRKMVMTAYLKGADVAKEKTYQLIQHFITDNVSLVREDPLIGTILNNLWKQIKTI